MNTPAYRSEQEIDIVLLWRAVQSRLAYLIGLMAVSGIVAYSVLSLVTADYTSETKILIRQAETSYTQPSNGSSISDANVLDNAFLLSQVQVVQSQDLIKTVARKLNLYENPEFKSALQNQGLWNRLTSLWADPSQERIVNEEEKLFEIFSRRLNVYQIKDTHVLVVQFTSSDPVLSATIANKLAEAYVDWRRNTRLEETGKASLWLNAQIETLSRKVAESEAKIEDFRKAKGLVAGSNNVSLNAQQLSELNSQLIIARAQSSAAQAKADLVKKMLEKGSDLSGAPDVLNSNFIQRLLEQKIQLSRTISELSASLQPTHPRMLQLNSELAMLNSQIRQTAQKIIGSLESEAQIAKAREDSLRGSLAEIKSETGALGKDEIELRALEREAKANRDLLETYLARSRDATARSDFTSVPSTAKILSLASPSLHPSFPKKGPMALLFMAAIGLVYVASIVTRQLIHLTGRVQTARLDDLSYEQEKEYAHLPSEQYNLLQSVDFEQRLKSLSRLGGALQDKLALNSRSEPDHSEQQKANLELKNKIRSFCKYDKTLRMIIAGETVNDHAIKEAVDLGRSFARDGLSVLLVDTWASREDLSHYLGLPEKPGFQELTANPKIIGDVLHCDDKALLHLVVPGQRKNAELSETEVANFIRIFEAWIEIYQVVIFHARADWVANVYEILGGKLEAGVFIQQGVRPAKDAISMTLADMADHFNVITHRRCSSDVYDYKPQADKTGTAMH